MTTRERWPSFVIIGAQKAASTTLLDTLRSHPSIWMPAEEDAFLRDPVYDEDRIEEFEQRYSGRKEPLVGLKCPDYLARPEVPARIAQHNSSARLILIVRNPIERAVSAYYWRVRWGALPIVDVNDGLRNLRADKYSSIDPTASEILTWGLYAEHLDRYLQYFDRDHILVLVDSDLRQQPRKTVRAALEFLGAPETGWEPHSSKTSNEGVYSLTRLRFLQLRNRIILKWNADKSYYTIFRPANPVLRLYSNLIAAIDRWILARIYKNTKPRLDPDTYRYLEDYYRADSTRLQELLRRRIAGWPLDPNSALATVESAE